jgi:hypothetical protein
MTTINNNKKKLKTSFSPSVNIIRDANTTLNYIATPNSKQAFSQIINDYKTGIRSFSIVGAYGIGKSAFLWAFEQSLNRKNEYFSIPEGESIVSEIESFDVARIVGDHGSFRSAFAEKMGLLQNDYNSKDVFLALEKHYELIALSNRGLIIIVDEFCTRLRKEYFFHHNTSPRF